MAVSNADRRGKRSKRSNALLANLLSPLKDGGSRSDEFVGCRMVGLQRPRVPADSSNRASVKTIEFGANKGQSAEPVVHASRRRQ